MNSLLKVLTTMLETKKEEDATFLVAAGSAASEVSVQTLLDRVAGKGRGEGECPKLPSLATAN